MYIEFGFTPHNKIAVSVLGSGLAELAFGTPGVAVQLDDEAMRELVTKTRAALDEMDRRCAQEYADASASSHVVSACDQSLTG
ncbi:hypothetical protein [Actinophytocola sp.]|uniref:hypothetical protein n=1 Tax=Actinophytocola sp. TaxID=1872138 RepID=UPI003D6A4DA9